VTVIGALALVIPLGTVSGTGAPPAGASPSGDGPPGYFYGTDSSPVDVVGSDPYVEPVIGGAYGGYFGMIGDWARWRGCRQYQLAWSSANSAEASTNLARYDQGVGTGAYWFMGGPGVDPHYNGTAGEAYDWGMAQAARTLSDLATQPVQYPVVFMDVEVPGSTVFDPAPDNGWKDVYSSTCSGRVTSTSVAPGVDRADFNGYAAYLTTHSSYRVGVYSSPVVWADIFGTGRDGALGNTYEWTYSGDTSSLDDPPAGWCLPGSSTCADFFGGINTSSPYALMWQWSGGGGTDNGVGDFDQIDTTTIR
jgi:hypothetical protein